MAGPASLTSFHAACCWVPLFALRCEESRRPELARGPAALLSPDTSRRLWQVSPIAQRLGVRPGMTVSQAIGVCAALRLVEPDPVHYDERFARLVAALADVSPAVEAEGDRVFVGTDGLERLHGTLEEILVLITRNVERGTRNSSADIDATNASSALRVPTSAFRLGWGRGKFVAATAARRARPGKPCIVHPGEAGRFLADQPISVLPIDPDTHRRLRLLGIRTLGRLAALPEDAVVSQFGAAGRRLWQLAAGRVVEPVQGRLAPEPIRAALTFYAPLADRAMIARALGQLVDRALKHPRRTGWRVQALRASAVLEHGASWVAAALLKDPGADRERLLAPLLTRLEHAPPVGAVERLVVEFTAFVPGTAELQLFARDAAAAARAGRRRGDLQPAAPPHAVSRHRDRAMVPPARTPLRADRLRPLNAPTPIGVGVSPDGELKYVGSGEWYPTDQRGGAVRTGTNHSPLPTPRVAVEAILDQWQLDDEWWRQRISRRYVEVMLEGGKRMLVFEDLVTGEWFEQTP